MKIEDSGCNSVWYCQGHFHIYVRLYIACVAHTSPRYAIIIAPAEWAIQNYVGGRKLKVVTLVNPAKGGSCVCSVCSCKSSLVYPAAAGLQCSQNWGLMRMLIDCGMSTFVCVWVGGAARTRSVPSTHQYGTRDWHRCTYISRNAESDESQLPIFMQICLSIVTYHQCQNCRHLKII